MEQKKRIRRGTAGWRAVIGRQASSGMSIREYCRREGINTCLFGRWQSRLAAGEAEGEPTPATALAVAKPFIDLGPLRGSSERLEVRLDLGGGLTLSILRG